MVVRAENGAQRPLSSPTTASSLVIITSQLPAHPRRSCSFRTQPQSPSPQPWVATRHPSPQWCGTKPHTSLSGTGKVAPLGSRWYHQTRVSATVKWFNVRKAYGFINRNETKEDVFVYQTNINNNARKYLGSVEDEEFDVVEGEKGTWGQQKLQALVNSSARQ